jgi:hypothetical protein
VLRGLGLRRGRAKFREKDLCHDNKSYYRGNITISINSPKTVSSNILFYCTIITLFIINSGCIGTDEKNEEKENLSYIEYGFNITTNSSDVNYLVKFPIPSNWELENNIIESEGNPEIIRTQEVIFRNKYYYGPTPEITDYIVINGTGNSKMIFGMKPKVIRNVSFPSQDFNNNTMTIYVEIHNKNESIKYNFWFEQYMSSGNLGMYEKYKCRGILLQNGWQKVYTEIIMS